jgi:LysR family transcriptional activator of nhaA
MNYHHLLYFWTVASCGSIAGASRRLRLAPQTLSAQIRALEGSLGQALFDRLGGRLELTDAGRVAMEYAEKIFALGSELDQTLRRTGPEHSVRIGVLDTLPRTALRRVVRPLLATPPETRVSCVKGSPSELAERLAARALDVVFSDEPIGDRAAAGSRLVGASAVAVYAAPALAARLRDGFPRSLDGAPLFLPMRGAAVRPGVDRWLANEHVNPAVKAELADSALIETLAREGAGAFTAPIYIETDESAIRGLERVGVLRSVRDPLYATTLADGTRTHAFVPSIIEHARALFAGGAATHPDAA